MANEKTSPVILIAEDDSDDYVFVRETLSREYPEATLRWVRDGEKLLDYLFRRGIYTNPDESPTPSVVLLDLNMPRMTGVEALNEIRMDAAVRRIPVVVLTGQSTQNLKNDALQVAAFLKKPMDSDDTRVLRGVIERFSARKSTN